MYSVGVLSEKIFKMDAPKLHNKYCAQVMRNIAVSFVAGFMLHSKEVNSSNSS
jgi:hypothetical protein